MIIEIGPRPLVAAAFPSESLFFSTESAGASFDNVEMLRSLPALWRALGRSDLELIVCHPSFSAPWSTRHLHRSILSRRFLAGRSPLFRAIGPELLRAKRPAPLVVIDTEDLPVINRNNLFLLDRALLYFKRELPADHWRVFLKTAHANLPTPRWRLGRAHRRWEAKLRPISLGLPADSLGLFPEVTMDKTVDIFFSGRVEGSSSLRAGGLEEVRALAARGAVVDIPAAHLPREAFYRRCAAAWLVWSPEGYGWDCFRHYEAAACGSVALINQPSIERHAPLLAGEHAVYYDPEPGGLTHAVMTALADRERLRAMSDAARAHVLAHHTPDALARYVVEEARKAAAS
ncbi:MAG TPA: glycosyltransferase [Caulobacteraceae bacterium]